MSDADRNAVINNLSEGFLMQGAQMLDDEGDLGNTPLLDAYTRWALTSKTAAAVRVQDKLFRAQGAPSKLRAINDQLRGMVQRHPWLEQAVDMTDIFSSEEFDRIANRQRDGATTTTMTPLGPVETTGEGGAALTSDGLDIEDVNAGLNLAGEGEQTEGIENVEVEGGMPESAKLDIAEKVLADRGPLEFGPTDRAGIFSSPYTPEQSISAAKQKLNEQIIAKAIMLNNIATLENDKIVIKKDSAPGIFGTPQRGLSRSEITARKNEAAKLKSEIDNLKADLKSLGVDSDTIDERIEKVLNLL